MYPEVLIIPMREELTKAGAQELHTAAEVDAALADAHGTALVIVNSVCGCAAGKMRPGVRRALQHTVRPDRVYTVFAGQDREATERARELFVGCPPSSPSLALFRNGSWSTLCRAVRSRATPQKTSQAGWPALSSSIAESQSQRTIKRRNQE